MPTLPFIPDGQTVTYDHGQSHTPGMILPFHPPEVTAPPVAPIQKPHDFQAAMSVGPLSQVKPGVPIGQGKYDKLPRWHIDDTQAQIAPVENWMNGTSTTVGAVLQHPTLFKAYPDLKNMHINLTDKMDMPDAMMQSNPETNSITALRPYAGANPDVIKSLLIHELQHAIQQRENFAYKKPNQTWDDVQAQLNGSYDGYKQIPGEQEAMLTGTESVPKNPELAQGNVKRSDIYEPYRPKKKRR